MTTGEIAKWVGVHPRTVQRWVSDHGLPAHGERGTRRITQHDFLAWASKHRFVREQVKNIDALKQLYTYEKAALYDLANSGTTHRPRSVGVLATREPRRQGN